MECVLCKKKFRDKHNLERHNKRKTSCISRQDIIKMYNELQAYKHIVNRKDVGKDKCVNRFGEENIDDIKIDYKKESNDLFISIVEQIYDKKENHTIIVYLKSADAKVFDGQKFINIPYIKAYDKIKIKVFQVLFSEFKNKLEDNIKENKLDRSEFSDRLLRGWVKTNLYNTNNKRKRSHPDLFVKKGLKNT